jgi:hypothetical protein
MTLSPHIAAKLRDYQVPETGTLVNAFSHHLSALDASRMGAGKTYVACATALALGKRPVVICRKAAFPSWRRCWSEHFEQGPLTISNWELVRRGEGPLGRWVKDRTRGGREYERFEWTLAPDSLLIMDECHWASGWGTQNGDLVIGATFQKQQMLMVSATVADSPLKMRAIGYALGLHKVTDFVPWLLSHGCEQTDYGFEFNCGMRPGQFLKREGVLPNGKPRWIEKPDGMAELLRRRREVMGRISTSIFGAGRGIRINDIPGFPENIITPQGLDFGKQTGQIRAAYEELRNELTRIESRMAARAAMQKCRQRVELFKLPTMVAEFKDAIDEGYSVAVFVNFTESLMELGRLMNTDCFVFGEQKASVREANIQKFQSNESRIIILNNQAGGESISLHDLNGGHPRIAYVFPSWWAIAFNQCIGRCPRNGAQSNVLTRIPFAAGTLEENALKAVERKIMNIDSLNDGDLQPFALTA